MADLGPAQNPIGPTSTRRLKTIAAEVDPAKAGLYDSEETVKHQKQQLPTQSETGVTFSPQKWNEAFTPFYLPIPNVVGTRALQPNEEPSGLTDVLLWKIDGSATLHGANVDYSELGYDERGYVCKLDVEQSAVDTNLKSEHIFFGAARNPKDHSLKADEKPESSGKPWTGQRFGKEWRFGLSGVHDDSLLSIAALQLCRGEDFSETHEYGSLAPARRRLAQCFLTQFKGEWDPLSRHRWGSSYQPWTGSAMLNRPNWDDLVFQYHMRVFTVPPPAIAARLPGPGLTRKQGELAHLNPDDKYSLRHGSLRLFELRYSVGLKTSWKLDFPVFSLVVMADSTASRLRELPSLADENAWDTAGIQPAIRATGISAFAFRIQSLMIPEWEVQWSRLINEIKKSLNADLGNILSPARRREMMVDSRDLRLSDSYFAVIQILRIAADWIQESMDDLRRTVDDIERLYLSPSSATTSEFATFLPRDPDARDAAIESFRKNWGSVMSHQQRIGNGLLARIKNTQAEVEGLRDGLFNATSVNEAAKSADLNHYILVFTVVTIFYLPLSFITALFALGLFDWQDPKQVTTFAVTLSLVAGGTYAFAWLLIWAVGDPTWRKVLTKPFVR
ncbi:hypothetical protein QBC47DRAFT_327941 [Echria macrotheca]|uniref:Uncharacterized protein n=1 Tax=Echria macrotheca TaxID=438768 RepID=A0AAJ0F8Z3_9PEZI|nr:hypothetical protein QBC47DRAFT_327941 [Echria macrotheca]